MGDIEQMNLSRKTPMTRTGFNRKPAATSKVPAAELKPLPGPRKRKCSICKTPYEPRSAWAKVCGPACAEKHAAAVLVKQRAKAQREERAVTKIKLEGMKTYPQIIKEVQRVFNQAVRLRDQIAGYPCISSGRPLDWSGNAVDSGHYRSTGSAPHLRFNFDNAHAQSKHDNQYKAGNAVDYRIGLIARIGLERVEALEADNTPRKWSREELYAMKADFQKMVLQLKRKLQS
jgi:hypothetical protein